MPFMLLQNYGKVESNCAPITEWAPADIEAHIEFQYALNRELTERGELVDARALTWSRPGCRSASRSRCAR